MSRQSSLAILAISLLGLSACSSSQDTSQIQITPSTEPSAAEELQTVPDASSATLEQPAPPPAAIGTGLSSNDSAPTGTGVVPTATPGIVTEPGDSPLDSGASQASEEESADNALKSIGRVLHGAFGGTEPSDDEGAGGSVLEAVGRALSKGFQEASTETLTNDE